MKSSLVVYLTTGNKNNSDDDEAGGISGKEDRVKCEVRNSQ